MHIGHIEIFVSDPLKSRDFYRDVLGCELVEVQGGKFVWLKLGQQQILLRPGSPARTDRYQQGAIAFVLYTDDLKMSMAELTSRGLEFRGTDGSDACPTFVDPDGHWFQLVNPAQH